MEFETKYDAFSMKVQKLAIVRLKMNPERISLKCKDNISKFSKFHNTINHK